MRHAAQRPCRLLLQRHARHGSGRLPAQYPKRAPDRRGGPPGRTPAGGKRPPATRLRARREMLAATAGQRCRLGQLIVVATRTQTPIRYGRVIVIVAAGWYWRRRGHLPALGFPAGQVRRSGGPGSGSRWPSRRPGPLPARRPRRWPWDAATTISAASSSRMGSRAYRARYPARTVTRWPALPQANARGDRREPRIGRHGGHHEHPAPPAWVVTA
jgi:hypothetical protein